MPDKYTLNIEIEIEIGIEMRRSGGKPEPLRSLA